MHLGHIDVDADEATKQPIRIRPRSRRAPRQPLTNEFSTSAPKAEIVDMLQNHSPHKRGVGKET